MDYSKESSDYFNQNLIDDLIGVKCMKIIEKLQGGLWERNWQLQISKILSIINNLWHWSISEAWFWYFTHAFIFLLFCRFIYLTLNINCHPSGRQRLLSACVSMWRESHKICKAGALVNHVLPQCFRSYGLLLNKSNHRVK